ncbi:MAG: hypothetical protein KGK34_05035 [Chloroflexota bacterium]|nr:hypothetical protein [Chloroflexota bacterium]
MARGFAIAVAAFLVLGGVAAFAYQAGATAAVPVPSGAPVAYPYYWHPFFGFGFFGFLFPLFFIFLVFGLVRAAVGGGWGHGQGGHRRMLEEWHREMHERQGSGTGDR